MAENSCTDFKKSVPFEKSLSESTKVLEKYPERVPIICQRSIHCKDIPIIRKMKYLVPIHFSIGQFIHIIRKRSDIKPEQAIFVFVNNNIPPNSDSILTVYDKYKDKDGFLYITYSGENTFG
tara:strand:+ start:491 stop:856 length:366 start_codon:yes stop_codon:yes gene_type:complete